MKKRSDERIVVVGLGYVGLPVAVAFAKQYEYVVGFDINQTRVAELKKGVDRTREVDSSELSASGLMFTADPKTIENATFVVVTVPTPIDNEKRPDLSPLDSACRTIGQHFLKPNQVVVFESTVYPGVTEEVCGPWLESHSNLKAGQDFFLGYSPERINPGDREHSLERTIKVVAGQNPAILERVATAYSAIVPAGVHKASSIKVAEAAKVIENTQRDLNIALMNELAVIFDRLGINTKDVLEAAGTKWNFLRFTPGLVGGHCIGVDPYYLTAKAESVGYRPEVILAGRRINDSMGSFVAQKMVRLLSQQKVPLHQAKVAVFGLTFKENVPDLRNSRVPDILAELKDFGINPWVVDPLCDPEEANHEYGIALTAEKDLPKLDGLILAVSHREFEGLRARLTQMLTDQSVVVDVKSSLRGATLPGRGLYYVL